MLTVRQKQALLEHLLSLITPNKKEKFEEYIRYRTRYVTVVLEDIFQPHNASAVLRTCDCFGVQDIHIIENQNKYTLNPDVALGSSKWVNLIKYNQDQDNTLACIGSLRENGYRIMAMTPHKDDMLLDECQLDQKIALLFGTEMEGLSEIALQNADAFIKIPMYGFTESLNISVSAAITLFHLTEKLRNSDINWQLSDEEILDTKLQWASSVIKKPDVVIQSFLRGLA
jgi:tRNA (guanosine-2'-O-)-methyltransferase